MDARILEQYVDKVYGYAVRRTYSREEADELSQEILYTALRQLPTLKDDSKFEPWLWGLAGNVTKSFRRYLGKQRAMYSYDTLVDFSQIEYGCGTESGLEDNLGNSWETGYWNDLENNPGNSTGTSLWDNPETSPEEQYAALRAKIAMLSQLYRDILILYYYDGLSTRQIADRLKVPEGTVTWRLSEARQKLKKECMSMEETALRPISLKICINGEGDYQDPIRPFPNVYISDALSQNILYHCYESPKTVEELAKICGVPAYYVEDSLRNLLYREAMSEVSKGKYRTEFIIYSDNIDAYNEKTKDLFPPIVDEFVASMRALAEDVEHLGIYTAGKPKEELIYLYGIMALEHLSAQYNPVHPSKHPVRYDGYRWSFHAHLLNGQRHRVSHAHGMNRQFSLNLGSSGTYSHNSWDFGGFAYRRMMYDSEINVCEDILRHREITDLDSAAAAIQDGFAARKEDGSLTVLTPAFTKEQYDAFTGLAEKAFAPCIDKYAALTAKYLKGYQKLFPAHLKEEVERACSYMFLALYASTICWIAQEKGLLTPPAKGSVCDVMIQFKKG